jgi:hypothetical protein
MLKMFCDICGDELSDRRTHGSIKVGEFYHKQEICRRCLEVISSFLHEHDNDLEAVTLVNKYEKIIMGVCKRFGHLLDDKDSDLPLHDKQKAIFDKFIEIYNKYMAIVGTVVVQMDSDDEP